MVVNDSHKSLCFSYIGIIKNPKKCFLYDFDENLTTVLRLDDENLTH